jgi:hypothetical protein
MGAERLLLWATTDIGSLPPRSMTPTRSSPGPTMNGRVRSGSRCRRQARRGGRIENSSLTGCRARYSMPNKQHAIRRLGAPSSRRAISQRRQNFMRTACCCVLLDCRTRVRIRLTWPPGEPVPSSMVWTSSRAAHAQPRSTVVRRGGRTQPLAVSGIGRGDMGNESVAQGVPLWSPSAPAARPSPSPAPRPS